MLNKYIQLLLAVIFLALAAQWSIEVPINNGVIPITAQSLAILLAAYFLGAKWGTLAVVLYVLLGVLGLPIYADGKSGWAVLTGGSGGYLIGFIVAAYFCGYLKERAWGQSFWKAHLLMTIGTLFILAFGIGYLAYLYDFQKAMEWGFYPFWQGAIIKIVLGALIVWGWEKWKPL